MSSPPYGQPPYGQPAYGQPPYGQPSYSQPPYPSNGGGWASSPGPGGSMDSGSAPFSNDSFSDPYADEPPLLEELGINFDQIVQKTWAVLTFRNLDANILHDSDLAGPLVFLLTFGFLLLLTGKISFGYIYGFGTLGCFIMYFLLNLMSQQGIKISLTCTVSVLGYCILPMVILSAVSVLMDLKSSVIGTILSILAILWCAIGASNLFVTALSMFNQKGLVAYPCALFYTVFALLTIF